MVQVILQNAHTNWLHTTEYMFHNLLVDLGYTVLDIDYREVMDTDVILEQNLPFMGGKDLTDQIDGKKYLVENHGIDASSWDLWGFLRRFHHVDGMLNNSKEFASGAALRSVTVGRITIMATPEIFLIS
jgi:hypothetical protein